MEELEVINIDGVTFNYPESEKSAVKDINLKVNEGEFILIVGPSGCGKSTLIRLINRIIPDYYGGTIKGEVYIKGKNIEHMSDIDIVKNIGMVYQHPEKQIILQDVERELAFGLENLNTPLNIMRRNVAEVISLMGLNNLKDMKTNELSGGEKQRVAIASVLAMNPSVIILDEPISQLDPIAAEEVLNAVKRLNSDMGKTIILVEQRIDKCFSLADRIIFMEEGRIIAEGTPNSIPKIINKKYHLPNLTYIFKKAGQAALPLDVKQGRKAIENIEFISLKNEEKRLLNTVLEVKKLNFEYKKGMSTLKNINFTLNQGEVLCVMGENGAGKTTLFKIITGLISNYDGKVIVQGKNIKDIEIKERIKKIGYLSQNPNDYFGRDTVFEEVGYTLKNIDEYSSEKVEKVLNYFDIYHLKDKNPRDLSGGEKQRVAIACTLVSEPDILILDEPTRGMDSIAKDNLGKLIQKLTETGKGVVIITHDGDFAADYGDTLMLMFNGSIISKGNLKELMHNSIYYSSQISKVFKDKANIVRSEDALKLLQVI